MLQKLIFLLPAGWRCPHAHGVSELRLPPPREHGALLAALLAPDGDPSSTIRNLDDRWKVITITRTCAAPFAGEAPVEAGALTMREQGLLFVGAGA
jgi:hypothetical protein